MPNTAQTLLAELAAWTAEPRYQDLRAMGRQYPQEVDALLMPWLARHTKAELESIAMSNNLIVAPLKEFDDLLRTTQFAYRAFWQRAQAAG